MLLLLSLLPAHAAGLPSLTTCGARACVGRVIDTLPDNIVPDDLLASVANQLAAGVDTTEALRKTLSGYGATDFAGISVDTPSGTQLLLAFDDKALDPTAGLMCAWVEDADGNGTWDLVLGAFTETGATTATASFGVYLSAGGDHVGTISSYLWSAQGGGATDVDGLTMWTESKLVYTVGKTSTSYMPTGSLKYEDL